jgi:hypothetical protein
LGLVFLSICSLFAFSGCEAYRSGSRNLFESNAPSSVTNTNLSAQAVTRESLRDCWTQSAHEPLPALQNGQTYSVSTPPSLNEDPNTDSIIEVCRDNSSAGDSAALAQ